MSAIPSSEPGRRSYFFSFNRQSSAYLWGGERNSSVPSDYLDYLYEFKYGIGAWTRLQLKGHHPPGIYQGSCARVGDSVFFYGGLDKRGQCTGSLYRLSLSTLTWQKLSSLGVADSPSKKRGCCIVEYDNTIIIHGGFAANGQSTNELHVFDISTGTWSSPHATGDSPKPNAYFAFTKVRHHTVIRCGGLNDDGVYMLNLSNMHWTKLHYFGANLSSGLTASCLGYESGNEQLLMIGLFGVQLLRLATLELKKLQDSDMSPGYKYMKRYGHSATVLVPTPTSVEILIFGGSTGGAIISATTLLILKKEVSEKWWKFTDFISEDRLRERNASYISNHSPELALSGKGFSQVDGDVTSNQGNKQRSAWITNKYEYPLLPLLKEQVPDTFLPGFSSEKNISVTYEGRKGSVDWEEYGLELLFEEDQSGDKRSLPIHISTGLASYSRFPSKVEPVSRVYHIDSYTPIKTSVTIRIQHNEKDNFHDLYFITCTDDQPPYDYKILHGGTFTSEYGEIVVSRFSLYTIGRLLTKYRVRGALSLLEKSYEASVYFSSKSNHLYYMYVSVLKHCSIFKKCMENFLKEEYSENVKLVSRRVVQFNATDKYVTAQIKCETNSPASVYVDKADCNFMRKIDISGYVESCPPHLKFRLHFKPGCTLALVVTLDGLEIPNTFTLVDSDLPDVSTSNITSPAHSGDFFDAQGAAFTMKSLELLGTDPAQQLRLVETISVMWEKAGHLLGLRDGRVRIIREDNIARGVEACCRTVFEEWLYDRNGKYNYNKSWEGMCRLLTDLELAEVATMLREIVF